MTLSDSPSAMSDQTGAPATRSQNELDAQAIERRSFDLGSGFTPSLCSFTLFPKLSIELRLKVWHFTFPESVEVYVGIPEHQTSCRTGPLFPVALWIHQESRHETLKHYCVFDRTKVAFPQIRRPEPLCFNPAKDVICLPYEQIFPRASPYDGEPLKRHLVALREQASKHMDKIHHLQITGVEMDRFFYTFQELFNLYKLENGAAKECYFGAYSSSIFHFPALRKIILEILWVDAGDGIIMADSLASTRTFVELHRDKFHGGKAPAVVAIWCPHPNLEETDNDLYLKMEKERVERLGAERDS